MKLRRWQVLENLIKANGWTRGVELGVLDGRTFKHVLTACPDLTLWGVDLFDSEYFAETREGRPPRPINLEQNYRDIELWRRQHAPNRSALIRDDTVAASGLFSDGSLDFVFIDADHRYEPCLGDIRAWLPKAAHLCGHDYNPEQFPGVVQAVDESFDEIELFDDHVWLGHLDNRSRAVTDR